MMTLAAFPAGVSDAELERINVAYCVAARLRIIAATVVVPGTPQPRLTKACCGIRGEWVGDQWSELEKMEAATKALLDVFGTNNFVRIREREPDRAERAFGYSWATGIFLAIIAPQEDWHGVVYHIIHAGRRWHMNARQ